jgi:ribonuclease HI
MDGSSAPDVQLGALWQEIDQAVALEKQNALLFKSVLFLTGGRPIWQGFCDGSSQPQVGSSGIGGYLVTPEGGITGEFAEQHGPEESDTAELRAIIRLLECATQAGVTRLLVHTDNQTVAENINAGCNASASWLYDRIYALQKHFSLLKMFWIPRAHNQLADWLSHLSSRYGGYAIARPVQRMAPPPLQPHCGASQLLVQAVTGRDRGEPEPFVPVNMEPIWMRRLREFSFLAVADIREDADIEDWMLDAAAMHKQRSRAMKLAEATGQPYRQLLAQTLRAAGKGVPLAVYVQRRLETRLLGLNGTTYVQPPFPLRRNKAKSGDAIAARRQEKIAIAQRLREERAKSIHVELYSEGLYLATSSDGTTQYEVDTFHGTCTCPDFYERGHYLRCKHLIAALNLEAELSRQEKAARAA